MVRKVERAPTHPGAILREISFPAMNVTISQAAREMGISRQGLHKVLAETRGVTPEMALRIGKYCGNGAGLWLRMQAAYDLWDAEQEVGQAVAKIPNRASSMEALPAAVDQMMHGSVRSVAVAAHTRDRMTAGSDPMPVRRAAKGTKAGRRQSTRNKAS